MMMMMISSHHLSSSPLSLSLPPLSLTRRAPPHTLSLTPKLSAAARRHSSNAFAVSPLRATDEPYEYVSADGFKSEGWLSIGTIGAPPSEHAIQFEASVGPTVDPESVEFHLKLAAKSVAVRSVIEELTDDDQRT